MASVLLQLYCEKHPQIGGEAPYELPLLNFIWLLTLCVQLKKVCLFLSCSCLLIPCIYCWIGFDRNKLNIVRSLIFYCDLAWLCFFTLFTGLYAFIIWAYWFVSVGCRIIIRLVQFGTVRFYKLVSESCVFATRDPVLAIVGSKTTSYRSYRTLPAGKS